MQEALLAPLAPWQTFSVLIGTAAATLTGLMFVVATLVAGVRVSSSSEAFATFNTPNVMHFCLALLVAAILSAPLLFIGIHNAWDNVTYIALELSRPQNQRRDQ
jgi:predicted transporter